MSPATEVIEIETLASAKPVESYFEEFTEQLQRVKTTAETLVVQDENDRLGMNLAGETRKALKTIRCAIENRRKELGEESLRRTQRINGVAKQMIALIEPLETRMLEQETTALRLAQERKAARLTERMAALAPFLSSPDSLHALSLHVADLADEQFASMLSDQRDAYEARLAREQKEREEVAAKARAEAEERARIIAENQRLKEEAEAREAAAKVERAKAEAERRAAEIKAEKEREIIRKRALEAVRATEKKHSEERAAAEAVARKEREKLDALHRATMKQAEEERAQAERHRAAEREAREKAEAELKAKRDAEEVRRKAEALAAKKAAAAPDREKLLAYARALCAVQAPKLTTDYGHDIVREVHRRLDGMSCYIAAEVEKL